MNEVLTVLVTTVITVFYLIGFLCLISLIVGTASKAWHKHADKEINIKVDWNNKNEKRSVPKNPTPRR